MDGIEVVLEDYNGQNGQQQEQSQGGTDGKERQQA